MPSSGSVGGISAITVRILLCLAAVCLGSVARPVLADTVYSNYRVGNGTGSSGSYAIENGCNLITDVDEAMAFTVPPGFDYTLDQLDITLRMLPGGCNSPVLVELWSDAAGVPGAFVASFTLAPAMVPSAANVFYIGTPGGTTTLVQNTTYWVVVYSATPLTNVAWPLNGTGVRGLRARRPPGGAWTQVGSNDLHGCFRVRGTPVTAQGVTPSYSSYTAPALGGPATVYLEVVCANLTNPLTMPVSVTIPPNSTPAAVCTILANAINACTGCPCWGPGCGSAGGAPYGFHADCCGCVLRVTNSNPQLCSGSGGGAFVCADHADGLNQYTAKKELEEVGGFIALEFRGTATGIPRDTAEANAVTVTRTLRCTPGSLPQIYQAQVSLRAGMTPGEIMASLLGSLAQQGDSDVFIDVELNRILFSPRCNGGNYDVAFQVNDTGVRYAFSPPFNYSFFDYVAGQTPSIPTVSEWGMIGLGVGLMLVGVFVIRGRLAVV